MAIAVKEWDQESRRILTYTRKSLKLLATFRMRVSNIFLKVLCVYGIRKQSSLQPGFVHAQGLGKDPFDERALIMLVTRTFWTALVSSREMESTGNHGNQRKANKKK